MKRTNFGEIFEGKKPGVGQPLCYLRLLTEEESREYGPDNVGIFNGEQLLGFVRFNDLFDRHGNRFYV